MAKIDLKDYLERLEEPEDREAVASREYQKELFEQYVQKGDNFPELRAQLLKEYQDGADLTGPRVYVGSSGRLTWGILAGPISRTTSSGPRPPSTRSSTGSSGRAL